MKIEPEKQNEFRLECNQDTFRSKQRGASQNKKGRMAPALVRTGLASDRRPGYLDGVTAAAGWPLPFVLFVLPDLRELRVT